MTTGASAVRRRVVLVTTEPLGPAMAGPAIRAVELGRVLAAEHDVVVLTTASCEGDPPRAPSAPPGSSGPLGSSAPGTLRWAAVDASALAAHVASAAVVVVAGDVLARHRWVAERGAAVVVDLYDPFHLELLEQARDLGEPRRRAMVAGAVEALNVQAALGDTFLCASARQRDLWLGQLAACGRVNPATYDADPSLRQLLRVVPFGVPEEPPSAAVGVAAPALRGVVDGIGADDDVLLWGGGIYNWFDPQTLIRAVDMLRHDRPSLRLVFMGSVHPNPAVATMRAAVAARTLSADLGLTGKHVFFSDSFSSGWVPYAERGRYLSEATIGVSTHHDHVETAFSFRTRVLDYLWAGLPVVTTGGDALADAVEAAGAGISVKPEDVDGLAAALSSLLNDRAALAAAAAASAALAQQYRWSVVAQPLLEFCRNPYRAPDLTDPGLRRDIMRRMPPRRPPFGVRLEGLRSRVARDGVATTARAIVSSRLGRLGRLSRLSRLSRPSA